jgi:dihydrolipoamide dehydrogenase
MMKVGKFPFSASGKARIVGEEEGFVKIVSEAKYDELWRPHHRPARDGTHRRSLRRNATESTAEELGRTMHAHPTISESVMEAAEGVHNLTIHF